jgi:Chalcone isomerase-like
MGLPRRHLLLAAAAAVALPTSARTLPPELEQTLPAARLHGQGRLRFLGLLVYDVRLWTTTDFSPERWAQSPIALEIEYARSLYGSAIAERSLEEMRRQGDLPEARAESWLTDMRRLFPDVKEGDRITGVKQPGVGAAFFVNGRPRGEVRDADFARRFFGIWLAPQTSEPALRQRLLGVPA